MGSSPRCRGGPAFCCPTRTGGGVLHHHQAAVEAAARRQHGRQPAAQLRGQQAEDAALGNVGGLGQSDRQRVEPQGQHLAVEVATRARPVLALVVFWKMSRIIRGHVDHHAKALAHECHQIEDRS